RLEASLKRIKSNTLLLSNKEGDHYVTHLVQSANIARKRMSSELQADPKDSLRVCINSIRKLGFSSGQLN
ncbi:hypothetical protein MZE56_025080, partial [Rahnella perminowiae]|nr:hypothetical protein [Rahnella perminowiae]